LHNVARLYKGLDLIHDQLKDLTANFHKAKEVLSRHVIPEAMRNLKVPQLAIDDSKFIPSSRFSASFSDNEKGMEWLRENGLGSLIKETVHPQTLSAAVREYIEEQAQTPPPDAIKTSTMEYTQIRKL
jgi:hypothetical protein